jgi:hypothetical protein
MSSRCKSAQSGGAVGDEMVIEGIDLAPLLDVLF